jgi:hypothetical protein
MKKKFKAHKLLIINLEENSMSSQPKIRTFSIRQ